MDISTVVALSVGEKVDQAKAKLIFEGENLLLSGKLVIFFQF
jgi:hypothetical protein